MIGKWRSESDGQITCIAEKLFTCICLTHRPLSSVVFALYGSVRMIFFWKLVSRPSRIMLYVRYVCSQIYSASFFHWFVTEWAVTLLTASL